MLNELFGTFILYQLSNALLPTDGAKIESSIHAQNISDPIVYGEQGKPFNAYVQFVNDHAPKKHDLNRLGVVTTAKSTIVIDEKTGVLLYGEKPYDIRAIGSVTKLMSVMVFLDTLPNLDAMVVLDPKTDLVIGGRQYIAFYEEVELRDVLGAVLIGSDNSATQALVRFSDMTEEQFVKKMNEKALTLGLSKTFFTDPTGIRPTNVSTAFDLTKLVSAVSAYEQIQSILRSPVYLFTQSDRIVTVENTNDAMRAYQGDSAYRILAGKTGYLPEAGYTAVSTVEHRGRRIHVVVMGSDTKDTRSSDLRGLAEWTFQVFRWPDEL